VGVRQPEDRRRDSAIAVGRAVQESARINLDPAGDPLEAPQCEVALATLDTAHVCAVNAEHVSERLLTESSGFAVGTQVTSNVLL
jgi:hypothetical protein